MIQKEKAEQSDPISSEGEGGISVRIIDQSGSSEAVEDGAMEVVRGFMDVAHANAFARAYVRDSIERCRVPGASAREVLESWFSFGENAETTGLSVEDEGWKASTELDDFIAHPATPMERDWRALDPRRLVEEDAFAAFEAGDEEDDEQGESERIHH